MTLRSVVSTSLSICIIHVSAQVQNALDFDGVDDEVVVPNASALIANSNAMSLTCWVYPTNAAPQFPDFDGFAGLRDNNVADFYLVQIAPSTTVEARMRNSTGVATDIVFNGLALNQWQHFAFVYNGSELTLYHNAISVGSTTATGVISSASTPLHIGNLEFSFNDFLLDGAIDEVSLWSKELSGNEVTCLMQKGIDPTATDLQLYYKFDQGIPNGNNAGIAAITDLVGANDGPLSNFALNGTSSNFIQGAPSSPSLNASICSGDAYPFNGQNLDQAGIYSYIVPMGACDSIAVLTLDVAVLDTSVTNLGDTLIADLSGASYQWIDCVTGSPVLGATTQILTATPPPLFGTYSVSITDSSGCTGLSGCHTAVPVGINEMQNDMVHVFPSITSDHLTLEWPAWWTVSDLEVLDASGRVVMERSIPVPGKLNVEALPTGTYILHVRHGTGRSTGRFVKRQCRP